MDLKVKLFHIPFLRNYLKRIIVSSEGGPQKSKTIRRWIQEYNVFVDKYTYGSCFESTFNIGGEVQIGRYCSFGPDVHYFGANHPMHFASMSPYFYKKAWGGEDVQDVERFGLNIGNDCWIGYGTIITCGCRYIGNGAVIGAGSVVTKDVDPYSIVVGNPAHQLRMRFDDETIQLLEKSRWYELEPNELLRFYSYIGSPKDFAKEIIRIRNMLDI